jgi:hypothetical protein
MPTDAADEPLNGSAQDLEIARRALRCAQQRIARLQRQMVVGRRAIVQAHRALGETGRKRGHRLNKRLVAARHKLDEGIDEARIDGRMVDLRTTRPGALQYLGMWRPPVPPESPEALDCSAVICTCFTYLRSSGQVRQHWETGCFDVPDYQKLETVELSEWLKEFEEDQPDQPGLEPQPPGSPQPPRRETED